MAQPQWATKERQHRLVQLHRAYKGRCLKGHMPCPAVLQLDFSHFVHTYTKTEITSHPVTAADVRDGTAVTFPSHGMGIVELGHAVSREPHVGPMRVAVQHEELSDMYGVAEERAVESWGQEDREARSVDKQLQQRNLPTGESGSFTQFGTLHGRRYDPIERDNYRPPKYHLIGYGADENLHRFAKVRIPRTNIVLHVQLALSIQELSRGQRKRLRKRGIEPQTEAALIEAAVASWWAS